MEELKETIRKIEIHTSRLVDEMLAGMYHSAFKGQGIEFDEVRPYQEGDEIRTIDWNVTARMGELYIKRFVEERELTVMLVIDVSGSSLFGTGEQSKKEIIAEIAATLAFSAIKNNDKVGLILFSSEVEKYIPPKKGTRHVLRVIRELLSYEPTKKKTNIPKALAFLANVQRRKAITFLVSDFFGTKYAHPLSILAKKHDLICVRVTDPFEKNLPSAGILTFEDLESGQIQTIDTSDKATAQFFAEKMEQRQKLLQKTCQKYRVGLIEIETDQSYINPMRHFFKKRKERR